MRLVGRLLLVLVLLTAGAIVGFRLMYGGGAPYPDVSTVPTIPADRVDTPIEVELPTGMVTASPDGRIFYTYHMLHNPERYSNATIFEWVDGEGIPFPNLDLQPKFVGAMGITVDRQGRMWIVKPGALAGKPTELLAVDVNTGALLLEHVFDEGEAGFAQDMRVSPDGKTVYLADTGLFRFSQANLIVFDVATQTARTVLKGHPTVSPQNWVLRKTNGDPYKLAFGLLTFAVGVDGIALTADGEWLYFAAMSHDSAYRIPTAALLEETMTEAALANEIEFIGKKPMSDGIELLPDSTLLITDVENGGLAALSPDGTLRTLTADKSVDWADSVTVAPDGAIWYTDSRLTDLIDQFAQPSDVETMLSKGPYKIHRIRP